MEEKLFEHVPADIFMLILDFVDNMVLGINYINAKEFNEEKHTFCGCHLYGICFNTIEIPDYIMKYKRLQAKYSLKKLKQRKIMPMGHTNRLFLKTHNYCANIPITDSDILKIPRELKRLFISGWRLTSKGIENLPQKLTHLTISTKSMCSKDILKLPDSIIFLDLGQPISVQGLKNLPNGLVYLELCTSKDLTNEDLKFLPFNLASLNLKHNEQIRGEDINMEDIPKTLIELKLPRQRYQKKDITCIINNLTIHYGD